MAISLNAKGRAAFVKLSPDLQKKIAGKITKKNILSPKPKDERTFLQKTADIGRGIGRAVGEFGKGVKEEIIEGSRLDTTKPLSEFGPGAHFVGMAKGVARLPAQIGAGFEQRKGIFGKWETDPEEFIQKMKFREAQDLIKSIAPAKGVTQAGGEFIGAESALTLGTAGLGALSELRHAPRIARFASGAGTEAGLELLRTGDPTSAAIAGVAGGVGTAIPKTILKKTPTIARRVGPTLAVAKKTEDPLKAWFKSVGLSGRKQLESYGVGGEAAAKIVDDFGFQTKRIASWADQNIGKPFRNKVFRKKTVTPEIRRYLETGELVEGISKAEIKWAEPLKDWWHTARGKAFTTFGKELDIGFIEDYLGRTTGEVGRDMLYHAPINEATDDLIKSGWDAPTASSFLDEVRAPVNKEKSISEILNSFTKAPTKRGAKGFTKERGALQLPDKWLESDVQKMFDKYFDDLSTEVAATRTLGKGGENLSRSLNEAVRTGGMPHDLRDKFVGQVYGRGIPQSKIGKVALSTMANLNLRNAWFSGTLPEFTLQSLRTGGINQLLAIADTIADGFKKGGGLPTPKGATAGLAEAGAESADIISRHNPFLVAFRAGQSLTDKININAAMREFGDITKKYSKKAISGAEEVRFKKLHGEPAFKELFDENGFVKKGITKSEIVDIARASHLSQIKPGILNVPLGWSSPLGRVATQFKSFMFPAFNTMWNSLTKGTPKQIAGSALSLATWGTAMGFAQEKIKGMVDRLIHGEQPEKEDVDMMTEIFANMLGAFDKSGGGALITDILKTAKYSRSPGEVVGRIAGGPAGSAMATMLFSPLMDVQNGNYTNRGFIKDVMKSTAIGRDIWRRSFESKKESAARERYIKTSEKKRSKFVKGITENIDAPIFPEVEAKRKAKREEDAKKKAAKEEEEMRGAAPKDDLPDGPVIDTGIRNVYGSTVKLTQEVGDRLSDVKSSLKSLGIDLKIGDSFRSHEVQKKAYESGKKGVAPPGTSFHEKGKAIDLSQDDRNMNNPTVFAELRKQGFKQHPSEWWHWSIGEFA